MKKFLACFVIAFVLLGQVLEALPRTPHRLRGVVRAVDLEKHVLTLEPGAKDSPREFAIVEGRTRLRRDRKPATLADVAVGQPVQLYYVLELGRYVAAEVAWKSGDTAGSTPR